MTKIFHQLGHNDVWNFTSIVRDTTGEGVILSPRHKSRDEVESLSTSIKQIAIFDPQFFEPGVARGKLATYDFYPQITAEGFVTDEYSEAYAPASAAKCVDFQMENDFPYLVIPTRYLAEMPTDFVMQQDNAFVVPFRDAIAKAGATKPVLLQLIVSEGMLKDEEYAGDLLNWITGKRYIHGVYLIVRRISRSKQIKDPSLLYSMLSFVCKLQDNQMEVVLGYLNTEAFLLTLADPTIITMGAYEANRFFNERNFQAEFDDGRKQRNMPNLRLYVPKLLQWIEIDYLGIIARMIPFDLDLFEPEAIQNRIYDKKSSGRFRQPEVYKHYFAVFSQQLREAIELDSRDRYEHVCATISRAIATHGIIQEKGIALGPDNDDSHLAPWLTAANLFAHDRGWRR